MSVSRPQRGIVEHPSDADSVGSSPRGIALDRTVFYAQGGGQSGDQGTLVLEDGTTAPIVNTVGNISGAQKTVSVSKGCSGSAAKR